MADHPAAARATKLAQMLDARFGIAGTPFRIGLDGLVGLVPGIGDTAMLAASAYIIVEAARAGVPKGVLVRMVANVAVDYVIGVIPLVGDLFDIGWKANLRNARLMAKALEGRGA